MKSIRPGWIFVLIFLITLLNCDADNVDFRHFTSTQLDGTQTYYIDHFIFSDHSISFRSPMKWLPIYGDDEEIVHYQCRTDDVSLSVNKFKLSTVPVDEKTALELYVTRIQSKKSPNFIKDARVRDIAMPSFFPQTYLLSSSEKEPPNKMVTYLIYSTYLYEISMEAKGKLTGIFRTEYGNLCQSISLESTVPKSKNTVTTESSTALDTQSK
jgi:hypothetical protein